MRRACGPASAGAVADLAREGVVPGLAVVLVGEDPASQIYVRNKMRQTVEAGMRSFDHALPASTSRSRAPRPSCARLNADPAVDGILVQLPLPPQIDAQSVIEAIDPDKDVDGFHPVNVGRLVTGVPGFVSCTPLGCLILIKSVRPDLAGLDAVVVGRSNIVGKPMAQLLLAENCTVTTAHSKTRDLAGLCRRADILVAAVGPARDDPGRLGEARRHRDRCRHQPRSRPGGRRGQTRLVGDVAFEEAKDRSRRITPVPGGVGPMTIACLLRNTLEAACRRRGIPMPAL